MSSAVATTIGPLDPAVRDEIAAYRDDHGHRSYNAALKAMLAEVDDKA